MVGAGVGSAVGIRSLNSDGPGLGSMVGDKVTTGALDVVTLPIRPILNLSCINPVDDAIPGSPYWKVSTTYVSCEPPFTSKPLTTHWYSPGTLSRQSMTCWLFVMTPSLVSTVGDTWQESCPSGFLYKYKPASSSPNHDKITWKNILGDPTTMRD